MPTGIRDTPTRERTRTAILRAALGVLTAHAGASMEEVAVAAGVARSTLHRYYPDRAALVAAVGAFVGAEYAAALHRARPDEGTGLAAYTRICAELLDGLPVFSWWMRATAETAAEPADASGDRVIVGVLERGQRDGSVDRGVAAGWLAHRVWAELYAAHHYPAARSAREVRAMCLRTLVHAVAARPDQ